jgi:hypothetical protein
MCILLNMSLFLTRNLFVVIPTDRDRNFELQVHRLRKLIDPVLGVYLLVPVFFLQQTRKLVAFPGNFGQIVFAEFAPLELDLVTHLFPIATDLLPIHRRDSLKEGTPSQRSLHNSVASRSSKAMKKADVAEHLEGNSTTSAYSLTSLPAKLGCSLFSHPTV